MKNKFELCWAWGLPLSVINFRWLIANNVAAAFPAEPFRVRSLQGLLVRLHSAWQVIRIGLDQILVDEGNLYLTLPRSNRDYSGI